MKVSGGRDVPVRPELPAVGHLDDLHVHAHGLAGMTDAAMDDVIGRQPAVGRAATQHTKGADSTRVKDLERAEPRQLGRDILDESADEIVVGRIAGQVVERRNRDDRRAHRVLLKLTLEGALSRFDRERRGRAVRTPGFYRGKMP